MRSLSHRYYSWTIDFLHKRKDIKIKEFVIIIVFMKIFGMESSNCSHENVKQEGGRLICQDCRLVLEEFLTSEFESKPNYFNHTPSPDQVPATPKISIRIADWIAWKLSGRTGSKFRKKK